MGRALHYVEKLARQPIASGLRSPLNKRCIANATRERLQLSAIDTLSFFAFSVESKKWGWRRQNTCDCESALLGARVAWNGW